MEGQRLEIVVRGATVVTASGRSVVDVGVRDGLVVQLGGRMTAAREIDASGLHVLPGAVDPHVHLTAGPELPGQADEPRWVDDFTTGSHAALAGGITTFGNMTFSGGGESMSDAILREAALASRQTIADVFLHPVWPGPRASAADDVRRLCEDGQRSLKIFTCFPDFDASPTELARVIRAARDGKAITLYHCEDSNVIDCCTHDLIGAGRGLKHFAESRPQQAEVKAVQRAVALCEETGAPTYIVHLSSASALAVCRSARSRGLPVYVETRPLYLYLTEERYAGDDAALYVGQPPLRKRADLEALWSGLADGSIHTVGSDHAPWRRADKLDASHTLEKLRPGVPELDTMLPMLISEGTRRGLSLERLVALTAENPARLFGLYPRKGTIAVGCDADLVLWDLRRERSVRADAMHSRADYTPYEGTSVTGWPVLTLRRGQVVFEDGRVVGVPGSGQVLRRGAAGELEAKSV